ncbi:Pimeloyl-ACP methyl ester carboxylesterase [Arboricoccus pini]|uniref:Pimeloyl-ACP methyl ester carboxylesterase n=1 Tax=Arboricoccus pini TaxID=1963835 RepID=A0A212Q576_9PROT|nr:alpha/beta hydrolase [Arboricoccus pini]SNB54495.1 Pimeloyl-ACP methyl ester carboxylesterase [Arboricoccus pini]
MARGTFTAGALTFTHGKHRYDVRQLSRGSGPVCLLLPALSSISTLDEMLGLAERLGWRGRLHLADWPGFGVTPAPAAPLSPDLLHRYMAALLESLDAPPLVIAAGHGSGYALHAAQKGRLRRLAMLAPTWRGPLPTMMGGRHPLQSRIRRAIELPVLGQLAYRLNLSPPIVRRMLQAHVMGDPAAVTPAYLAGRRPVIVRRNARFATAAFVTGALDPFRTRRDWLRAAAAVNIPLLAIAGGHGPPRSQAEMEALAAAGIPTRWLRSGRLGLHEELPAEVAALLRPFLAADES